MTVHSGTTANGVTTNSEGLMHISSGGLASSTTVNSGGGLTVSSGGTAMDIVENGGHVNVLDGATVNFAHNVIEGLEQSGRMTVHSGTTASSTTMASGGSMHISSGGLAIATTVNVDGSMCISSGGLANGVVVVSGGALHVSGVLTGIMQIESGAFVSAYRGATIDFTVADQGSSDSALLNDWSRINVSSEANYTITVNDSQAYGTYRLADLATYFDSAITVKTVGQQSLGTVSLDRNLDSGPRRYALVKENGTLYLHMLDIEAPVLSSLVAWPATPTNQDVTVTATFTDNVAVASLQCRLGGGEWQDCAGSLSMPANGTVYFRAFDAAGNVSDVAAYVVTNISKVPPASPSGLAVTQNGAEFTFSWEPSASADVAGYELTLVRNGRKETVTAVEGTSVTLELAESDYTWSVVAKGNAGNVSESTAGEAFRALLPVEEPQAIVLPGDADASLAQGTAGDDAFSLQPDGKWGTYHVVRWNGGADKVSVAGRNRFYDAMDGAGGYDVLALPDGDNALLYTDMLSPKAEGGYASSRLAGISEIRGNGGNDVIDLTAADGCYPGDILLKGGAGDDLYLFGSGWGRDTVVDDGGTLVFDKTLQGKLTVSATDSGTSISDGLNTVDVSWQVNADDLVFAEVGTLEGYRRDTIKAFLA